VYEKAINSLYMVLHSILLEVLFKKNKINKKLISKNKHLWLLTYYSSATIRVC